MFGNYHQEYFSQQQAYASLLGMCDYLVSLFWCDVLTIRHLLIFRTLWNDYVYHQSKIFSWFPLYLLFYFVTLDINSAVLDMISHVLQIINHFGIFAVIVMNERISLIKVYIYDLRYVQLL